MKRIGEVVKEFGVSADTLRYYEKIELMPPVQRTNGGARYYNSKDLSRLRFIKRAQKMGFSLDEITQLLGFREDPRSARPGVSALALQKLAEIEDHLQELTTLRDELRLLTGLCRASEDSCPILENFDTE